jgi:hypothetical protein
MFFYKESPLIEVLPNNNSSAVFLDSTNFIWNNDRGYYRDATDHEDGTDNIDLILSNASGIKKIQATFTNILSYNSSGYNLLYIKYTDNTENYLGPSDGSGIGWDSSGQYIYKGDAGIEAYVVRNVINETYTLTIPVGKTISKIELESSYLAGTTDTLRGIKDITLYY